MINSIKDRIKSLGYYQVYIIIASIVLTTFLIRCVIYRGNPLGALMINIMTRYDDFFLHFGYASAPFGTNIYELSDMICFPPLAYLMYGFLARIAGYQAENYGDADTHQAAGHNLAIYILYTVVCIILLIYAISLYRKKKSFVDLVLFPILLLFTFPFAFSSIQRGNSVLLVVSLIAVALAWKDDKSKVKREAAMILIAVCAGLKIYPAVLGLLYLKEKRWKETLRLIIYGAVLFFVPFIFYGGFAAMSTFFNTVFSLYGDIHECSVSGVIYLLVKPVFGDNAKLFASIVQQLFLILCLIAFFLLKEKWAQILILCGLMTVYISSGWMYTCIYILPPMLMFFKEQDDRPLRINKSNWQDLIAFLLFLIVFTTPLFYGYLAIYRWIVALISLYALITIIRFCVRKFKEFW